MGRGGKIRGIIFSGTEDEFKKTFGYKEEPCSCLTCAYRSLYTNENTDKIEIACAHPELNRLMKVKVDGWCDRYKERRKK